ncbi:M23 family peptidase [Actinomadura craniellae]|uniref:M23 family peptidase n=1 Tax=Actinomadura craniellae TaxID=2231787 RepID=A0A365H4G3_9ACTN|nr:M23 family metallopeptidase [Actinomadura craniellae]RAY13896.1 M23 family peptidase [Actinomadura craniellae]
MHRSFPRLAARVRLPLLLGGIAVSLTGKYALDLSWLHRGGYVIFLAGLALMFVRLRTVGREPVEVSIPVAGRWIAVNGPGDRVPSHGTHLYAQTYAVDLLHWPDETKEWQAVHAWPIARRPETYPSFGQPIHAPADGTVVRASGRQRDHWSRGSWLGLLYLFVMEGVVRPLGGARWVLGNHLVLDLGDGVYAVLAHLRRGSLLVREGERVRAGQPLAQCGNSGNSSEPHLHFQLMDRPTISVAAGLPFRFDRFEAGGEVRGGVPVQAAPFVAAPAGAAERG